MDRIRREYDESFRRYVVEELESGALSLADCSKEYGVAKSLLKTWAKEYGRFRPERSVVEVIMKSEKEKIAELEKALSAAHLKNLAYEELIKIANKKYKTDIKKNFGTQVSGILEEEGKPSKSSVRSSK
jgi:transposase-like protein